MLAGQSVVIYDRNVPIARIDRIEDGGRGADRLALLAAQAVAKELSSGWHEVVPSSRVRSAAERLLRVHPLRAADSLQLAAAQRTMVAEAAQCTRRERIFQVLAQRRSKRPRLSDEGIRAARGCAWHTV